MILFLSPRGALKRYSEAGKIPLRKKKGINSSSPRGALKRYSEARKISLQKKKCINSSSPRGALKRYSEARKVPLQKKCINWLPYSSYLLSLETILIPRQTPQTKYMLKVNKKNTTARHELFSKLTRKQNNVTEVVRMSSLLVLNTFHPLH